MLPIHFLVAEDSLKTVKSSLDTVKEAIDSFDKAGLWSVPGGTVNLQRAQM